jgi:3-dehydroquinate synthase
MILNFGHTIGHAIEAASDYRALLHGEAIAWGMLAALDISRQRNLVSAQAVRRIESLIRYFEPPALPSVSSKRLLQAASGDKKNRAGVRRFVLLRGLGDAVVVEDVSDAELLAAIKSIRPVATGSRK